MKEFRYEKGYYPSAEGGDDGWFCLYKDGQEFASIFALESDVQDIVDALQILESAKQMAKRLRVTNSNHGEDDGEEEG